MKKLEKTILVHHILLKLHVYILFVFSFCHCYNGQGLLSYFKWEADGLETEKFDRIAIDVTWNHWKKSPPGINQGLYSFGFGDLRRPKT